MQDRVLLRFTTSQSMTAYIASLKVLLCDLHASLVCIPMHIPMHIVVGVSPYSRCVEA